jgi:hypothetical protein
MAENTSPPIGATVRTIEDARAYIEQVGLCTIFEDRTGRLPSLWEAVDAPDKQPGERGWGEKMGKVWSWKNELPARYPNAIFYGKLRGGRAILCTFARLREIYKAQHRALAEISQTARDLYTIIQQGPIPNRELRYAVGLDGKAGKNQFDRALLELQVAMLIARLNHPNVATDTWVPFETQYPELVAKFATTD